MYKCLVAPPQQGSELCAHKPASKCYVPYTYKSVPSFSGSVGCNMDHHTPEGGDEEGFKWGSVQWGDPRKGPSSLKLLVQTVLLCPIAGGCRSACCPQSLLSPPELANRGPDSRYARAGPLIQETSGKDPKATYDEIPPAFSQSPGGLKLGAVLRRQRQQSAALQRCSCFFVPCRTGALLQPC